MTVDRNTLAHLCRMYGSGLSLPGGLDGARVLWAIAGNESSFGANCAPRHERAYDKGGFYYLHSAEDRALVDKYGALAASSFGPWQILLVNAPDCSPQQLDTDPDLCAQKVVRFLMRYIVGFRQAATLEEIAQTYNSGSFCATPGPAVLRYAADARRYYDTEPLPGEP